MGLGVWRAQRILVVVVVVPLVVLVALVLVALVLSFSGFLR